MQDFTTPNTEVASSLNGLGKTKWLNKDRIWTLVFWFGMSSGFALGTFIKFSLKIPELLPVILLFTFLGVPLIVTLANRTRLIKDDTFANSDNIILSKKQLPTGAFLIPTLLSIGATFAIGDKDAATHVISSFLVFSGMFSGISLYFLFKNCPISIVFNYKFWTITDQNAKGSDMATYRNKHVHKSVFTDSSYSYIKNNFYSPRSMKND